MQGCIQISPPPQKNSTGQPLALQLKMLLFIIMIEQETVISLSINQWPTVLIGGFSSRIMYKREANSINYNKVLSGDSDAQI